MKRRRVEIETRFEGVPLSPGVALAPVCLFDESQHLRAPAVMSNPKASRRETERLHTALGAAIRQLTELHERVRKEIGPAEADIFTVQRLMLEDETLRRRMVETIRREGASAEGAVLQAMEAYEARMARLTDERMRQRATDIGEIKRRVLDLLRDTRPSFRCQGLTHCGRGRNRIVAAVELTPGLTVELDRQRVKGFVTEHGGVTSHAAILARSLGIPAVSGLAGIHSLLDCGTELLVDGDRGLVVAWPGARTLARYRDRVGQAQAALAPVPPVPGLRVMANISVAEDVEEARRMKAEGIGLYRTEFEMLAAGRMLDEDEQAIRYAKVRRRMGRHPVHIRLLDLGGDKPAPFLKLPAEENPALGFRGARLLLGHPELLTTQARAIARASREGPIHVTYPMIVDTAQFVELRKRFLRAIRGLRHGPLFHGVMFEVPAACLAADEILAEANFGSVGTNDLYQYLFAVDRNNELVARDFRPDRPEFWNVIRALADAARQRRRPLALCGEIAGWPDYARRLMALGVETLSVSPRVITAVRQAAGRSRKEEQQP